MIIEGLSGNLWPVHLKPYPNELLSSWLVRLAHGHGLKLQTFCAIVFGRDKNIWNRDIDKFAPDWLIEYIATATGTSIQNVINTTLKSYEGILYETHQPNGNTKWINPLGIYHRTHKHFGLQFCPICLAHDKEPYFRKYWRLAFYTECEKHHILLHDRCPNCGHPINFHRVEMGVRSLIKPKSVVNCFKCDYDLRDATKDKLNSGDWETTIQHRTLLDFHEIGWGFTDKFSIQYLYQLLDVLRHLCVLMSSKRRANCLLPYVARELGFEINTIDCYSRVTFEKFSVSDRHILFHCSIWLVLDWPQRFINVCKINNLTYSYLLHDYLMPPFWFHSIIYFHLNISQYSPTLDEICFAKSYLLSMGQKAGITKTSRLLGYSTLKR